ncbi:MAG TPA: imidazole glycerol phosphate synthase subunit HisH [Candidatus Limnocylindrales bacterium]
MKAWQDVPRATGRQGTRIAVIDYGAGNLVSIEQALTTVGTDVVLARTPADLDDIDAVVVPGVGAAEPAMRRLAEARLVDPILQWIKAGRPYLGICLGLQLLFERSDEDGADTFGVIEGPTVRLAHAPTLPHIGWNQVVRRRDHPLFEGIAQGADFYFVHSYAGAPAGVSADRVVLADTEHGSSFASAVDRGNVLGVQFHPERSGSDGLRLLANFVRWSAALAAGAGAQYSPVGAGGTAGGD